MLTKLKTMVCTSAAAIFVMIAVSNINATSPIIHYQPKLPQRD